MGGATFSPQGYINEDLSLTNASSYIELPYINLISFNFTIELWILIEYFSANTMILVSQDDLTLRVNYNGKVFISGIPPSVGIQLVTNTWYHIALVYDVNVLQQQIYVKRCIISCFLWIFSTIRRNLRFGAL
jgi:hypothetical protein